MTWRGFAIRRNAGDVSDFPRANVGTQLHLLVVAPRRLLGAWDDAGDVRIFAIRRYGRTGGFLRLRHFATRLFLLLLLLARTFAGALVLSWTGFLQRASASQVYLPAGGSILFVSGARK